MQLSDIVQGMLSKPGMQGDIDGYMNEQRVDQDYESAMNEPGLQDNSLAFLPMFKGARMAQQGNVPSRLPYTPRQMEILGGRLGKVEGSPKMVGMIGEAPAKELAKHQFAGNFGKLYVPQGSTRGVPGRLEDAIVNSRGVLTDTMYAPGRKLMIGGSGIMSQGMGTVE